MNLKAAVATLVLMIAASLLAFQFLQRPIGRLINVALDPDTEKILSNYQDDLRLLSRLDPENRERYRKQFEGVQERIKYYTVLELSRDQIRNRTQNVLLGMLALILVSSAAVYLWQQGRVRRQLKALRGHLEALAAGRTDIRVGNLGGGILGRIGRMIELTSGVMARQRKRLASMESLGAWQEAARRHAHEIRTPLTAARMELNQLAGYVVKRAPQLDERVSHLKHSIEEELDQLKEFTQQFTSFARIGKPKLTVVEASLMLARFAELFADAWSNLELAATGGNEDLTLVIDKDMVRQVLVNLCNNSSLALAGEQGRVTLAVLPEADGHIIQVSDNGPGIPEEVGARLFEPYTTSRKIGEGMGLGLAISRKIMLDHGGDLVLHKSDSEGATFRLLFPSEEEDDSGTHHGG